MVTYSLTQAEEYRAGRDHQDARRIVIVQVPHPESHTEDLEDVEGVQDLRDEDPNDGFLGHIHFAFAEFHPLELAE